MTDWSFAPLIGIVLAIVYVLLYAALDKGE
jgi:hypothetical protein